MSKKFDCVEMKHKGAEKVLKEISGLSPEEELKFWQQQTKMLKLLRQKKIAEKKQIDPGTIK